MKYIILLLFISNASFALANTCSSLFAGKQFTEAELTKVLVEIRSLKKQVLNNGSSNNPANTLLKGKLAELSQVMPQSEIAKRIRELPASRQETVIFTPDVQPENVRNLFKLPVQISESKAGFLPDAFTKDHRYVLASFYENPGMSRPHSTQLLDLQTRKTVHYFQVTESDPLIGALSQNRPAVAYIENKTLVFKDFQTQEVLYSKKLGFLEVFSLRKGFYYIRISNDDRYISITNGKKVTIFDTQTDKTIEFKSPDDIRQTYFSFDNKKIYYTFKTDTLSKMTAKAKYVPPRTVFAEFDIATQSTSVSPLHKYVKSDKDLYIQENDKILLLEQSDRSVLYKKETQEVLELDIPYVSGISVDSNYIFYVKQTEIQVYTTSNGAYIYSVPTNTPQRSLYSVKPNQFITFDRTADNINTWEWK